jgi:hypothetical protein
MAQAFDTRRLELTGEPVPIAENVSDIGAPRFSVSTTGVLAYQTGGIGVSLPATRLTWFDRTGKTLGSVGETSLYNTVAVSPDGTRVAFSRVSPQVVGAASGLPNNDLWVHEFARNTSTKLTFPLTGDDRKPVQYLQTDANEARSRFCPTAALLRTPPTCPE